MGKNIQKKKGKQKHHTNISPHNKDIDVIFYKIMHAVIINKKKNDSKQQCFWFSIK